MRDELFTWGGHRNKLTLITYWLLALNAIGNTLGLVIQIFNKWIYDIENNPISYYSSLNGLTLVTLGLILPFCQSKINQLTPWKRSVLIILSDKFYSQ